VTGAPVGAAVEVLLAGDSVGAPLVVGLVGAMVGEAVVGPAVGAVVGLVGATVGEAVVGPAVGAVVGLVGATVGDTVGAAAAQHSTQPLLVTELSVRHVKVSFSATGTLCGPIVPAYRVPPMVTESQQRSVANSVAVRAPAASTRTVQASLLAWLPTPEDVHRTQHRVASSYCNQHDKQGRQEGHGARRVDGGMQLSDA